MGIFNKSKKLKTEKLKTKKIRFRIFLAIILSVIAVLLINSQTKIVENTVGLIRKEILESQGLYTVSFWDGNGLKLWEKQVEEGYTFVPDGEDNDELKTFTYHGDIPERSNHIFNGWISSTGSNVITQNTDFTAVFTEDTKYALTVRYIKHNGEVAASTYVQLLSYGESYSIVSPEVEGYTTEKTLLEGVITDEKLEEFENDENVSVTWDDRRITCTIILTVEYLPEESSYQIIHWKQDKLGIQYEQALVETINDVRVGDVITNVGKEKNFTGFTLNVSRSTFDGEVLKDGKTTINIYYDRNVYYNYYDTADGEYIEVSPILYEANPNVLEKEPTREGYKFVGWDYYKEDEEDSRRRIKIDLPETMETYDIFWVAKWEKAESRYTVTYWKENADDEDFTNIGMITIEDGVKTGDRININDNIESIKEGFNSLTGNQRDYFTYDIDDTRAYNPTINIDDFEVKADGSTNINICYKRNVYKLRFYAGRESSRYNQIATGTNGTESACNWTNVNNSAKIDIDGTEYENNSYVIEAKFEQDISRLWPTADKIADVTATNSTTYHFISWGTSSDSPYWKDSRHSNKNILGNYSTMASELIIDPTNPDDEHELFGYWSSSQAFYKYHYMLENIDPTSTNGTQYEGKYYTEANSTIVKSTNTKANQNAADIFGYDLKGKNYSGSASDLGGNSTNNAADIYFYYDRHKFTITFYNVNVEYIPTTLSAEATKNGIVKEDNVITGKYGADLACLQNEYLNWIEDEENQFKNPLVTTGLKQWNFGGWYKDRRYNTPFNWTSRVSQTKLTENIVFYAKWEAPTYEIKFDVNNGNWNETDEKYHLQDGLYVVEEEEGDSLVAPTEPTRDGYVFDGWYYKQTINGREYEVQYLFSESQVIYDDVKLTAKWIRVMRASYKVRYIEAQYDDTGKLIEDIKLYNNPKSLAPDKQIDDILIGTIVTEQAIIIENENGLYVVKNREKSLTINNDNIDDNTICFFYTETSEINYTVYFVEDTGIVYGEGEIPDEDVWLAEPIHGKIVDEEHINFTATSQYIRGYIPNAVSQTLLLVVDENKNIIIFYYKENVETGKYKINYYFMNENNTYPANPNYSAEGEKGVGFIIYAGQYEEYLPDAEEYVGHTLDYEYSDTSGIITSTGETTIINLYFKNETYKVKVHTQGGSWQEGEEYTKVEENVYETSITYPNLLEAKTTEREGHKFLGWYELINQEEKRFVDLSTFNFEEPITQDTELYAVWAEQKEMNITKNWDDDNNRDRLRPTYINVEILRDLQKANDVIISDRDQVEENKWNLRYNIDKYDYSNSQNVMVYEEDGIKKIKVDFIDLDKQIVEIIKLPQTDDLINDARLEDVKLEPTFTIKENEIGNYETEYNQETLTISNSHETQKVSKSVTLEWVDDNDRDRIRPESVTIRLLGNKSKIGEDIVLNSENGWSHTWENLNYNEDGTPIEYEIQEIKNDDYDTTISKEEENKFKIVKTHNPETINYTVEKQWNDNRNQDGKRPTEITVKVLANGVELDGSEEQLSEDVGWKHTYTLYKNDQGEEIDYKVSEVVPNNYRAEYIYEKNKATIINTHDIEKTNKVVTKEWNDKNNQDAIRPSSVFIQLNKNNKKIEEIELNSENDWTYYWNDLDVYENGNPITYSIEELDIPEDYNASYDQENLKVTNTHNVATVSKTVKVEWKDKNNQDRIRPESVKIKLYADGVETEEIELSDDQDWTYTWPDLDKNKDGNPINYTVSIVKEGNLEKYTTEQSEDTFTITNTYEVEKVTKTATVIWVDGNDQDGKRPEQVTLLLLENGLGKERVTIGEAEGWTYTWSDLDKNSEGTEISYTIEQVDRLTDYTTTYNQETMTVTNSHTPETTSKTITKIWRDSNNQEGFRPQSVNLQLYADGEKVGDEVTLSAANRMEDQENHWTYTYDNLPVYSNGNKIEYTVKEPVVPDNYGVLYNQKTLTVYNAFPPEVDVSVTKVWNDGENADGLRPEKIQVQLKADGKNYMVDEENIGLVELNEANNWTYKWEFIEKYNDETDEKYVFTIDEIGSLNGYETTYPQFDEEEDMNLYEFKIINNHTPEKTTRTVTKKWEDFDDNDGKRPSEIKVNLLANGEIFDTVSLNNENGFTYTWDSLNKNALGETIDYSIEEIVPDGYEDDVEYNEQSQTFNITNKHQKETISKKVNVVWDDKENQDRKRPESIKVQLKANGENVGQEITLNNANNWSYSWDNLDKYKDKYEIVYSIGDLDVQYYTTTIEENSDKDGFIITNSYTPETISKKVTKVWNDNDNQDVLRPRSVQVRLKANGSPIRDVVTLKKDNWSYTWENLDKFSDGEEIDYEVEEITKDSNYVSETSLDEEKNFVITNTHIPNTITRKIIVKWEDKEDQDRKRPEVVNIQLKADGDNYREPIIVKGTDDWETIVTDLPERKPIIEENNTTIHFIEYFAEALSVNEYTSKVELDKDNNIIITYYHEVEKTEITVVKEWNDKENQDNVRPLSVEVQLKIGDEIQGKTVTLSDYNNWKYVWHNLDKNRNGDPISYSVEEINVDENYSAETKYNDENQTFTITNTHIPETTERLVKKIWNDNENQDGKRPSQVIVKLSSNINDEVKEAVLNEENGWTYSYQNLDRNHFGEEIVYSIAEAEANEYTNDIKYDKDNLTFTITNTHTPETTERTVTKEWNDNNNQNGKRPNKVTVQLVANNEKVGAKIELNEANGWTYTWRDLDKYKEGDLINYFVEEDEVQFYSTKYQYESESQTFKVINTNPPEKIQKSVRVVWDDANNQDGKRPEFLNIQLKANEENEGEEITLNADNNWTYTWSDLDKYETGVPIEYSIDDIFINEYYTEITKENDEFIITSSYTPETIDKNVMVLWEDNDNQDGYRPENVVVKLKAENVEETERTFNNENGWINSWDEIYKYKDGHEINYYLETEDFEHYSKEVIYNAEDQVYLIIYTHDLEKIEKQVEIKWVDDDNKNETRSPSISVQLYANGEPTGEIIVLSDENDWKVNLELDKNSNGEEITYTAEQLDILEDYETSYSEDTFTITNVLKEYNYRVEYYYDGERDDGETLYLKAKAGDIINSYPNRIRENYDFISDNLPLTITSNQSENVIKVFYERKAVTVKIKYLDRYNNDEVSKEINIERKIGDTYNFNEYEKEVIGYTLIEKPDSLEGTFDQTYFEIIFYYAKNATLTVKYLEKGTNSPLETEEKTTLYQGRKYNVTHKDIDGYTYLESTNNTEGTVQRDDIEVIFYYAKNTYITVKYVDRITLEELEKIEIKGYEGQEYTVVEKEINGYTFISKTDNSSGVFTKTPQEVVLYYAKNTKVTVLYLEKETEKELDRVEIQGYEGKEYKTEGKDISGYTFIEVVGNTEGTMLRDGVEVKYYYLQNSSVKIEHIDKMTNTVLKEEVKNGKVGDIIKTAPIDIPEYIYVQGPENPNVELTKEQIVVRYYYSHVSNGVLEKHIDNITGEIIYSSKHEGVEGDSYNIDSKSFEGYDLVTDKMPQNSKGTMTKGLIEVQYYYIKKASVKVLYIDKLTDQEIIESTVINGHENDSYETEKKEIENYVFINSTENTKGTMTVSINSDGTFNSETIVKYFYIKKSEGVLEEHIDLISGEVLESKTYEGKVTDDYVTGPIEIDGYDLVEDKIPENNQGQMSEKQIVVKYYYIKRTKVIVKYIDILTHEELHQEVITGHEKDKYETNNIEIDGYELSVVPKNLKGEMTKEDIIVEYFYIRKARVIVEYFDNETGEKVSKDTIINGHIGETYSVNVKDMDYYRYVESSNNLSGKMNEEETKVKLYYEKLKFDMKIDILRIRRGDSILTSNYNVYKFEIPASQIRYSKIVLTFVFRIQNVGEIEGNIDEIRSKIPYGYEFDQSKNEVIWSNDNNTITTTQFSSETLKPGEYKDIELTLTWNGELNALGQITNEIVILKSSNQAKYQDIDSSNDKAVAITLFAIKTGQEREIIIDIMITLLVLLLPISSCVIGLSSKKKK